MTRPFIPTTNPSTTYQQKPKKTPPVNPPQKIEAQDQSMSIEESNQGEDVQQGGPQVQITTEQFINNDLETENQM